MAIVKRLLTVVVALSLGVGVAAGAGVIDPVETVATQVCEPDPGNVTQDSENISQDHLVNSTGDDPNVTARQNGTDGDDMTVIEGEDLVRLALQQIAPDTACDVQTSVNGS